VRFTVKIATAVVLSFLVAEVTVPAEILDDLPEVISLYAKGKRLIRGGSYLEASRVFEEIAGRFPSSPNIDLIIFNRAKADYHFGDYDKALAGFKLFASRFPRSPLRAHALFFQANADYIRGRVNPAVRCYIDAYGAAGDKRLRDLIVSSIGEAIADAKAVSLGAEDFEGLSKEAKCTLIVHVVDMLTRRGDYEAAEALAHVCGSGTDIPLHAAGLKDDKLRIAVALPLSGELQSFGEDIYTGAIIAAEFYRAESGREVSLEPYDTKGDPIDAARIVRELADSPVDVVIGPLTSEEAAVASAVLACNDLPMLAPAATQAGLTMLSETSFQLSPNVELQGTRMAEYAIYEMQADSAVIITSTDTDHLQVSRAFADRFTQLGGTIVAAEYYRPRDRDFGQYVRDVKAILLGPPHDSVFYINEYGDTLDPDGVPAYVECLYLPGSPSQLKQLLPQINFYNLTGAYLGSDGWGDEAVYKLGDHVTKQAVFPSPFLQKGPSYDYSRFAAAYDSRYGKEPQRLAALGFDAVRLVTGAFAGGGATHSALTESLASTRDYAGVSGVITFGDNRENIAMPIYRIESQEIVYLGVRGGMSESGAAADSLTTDNR
jgi:branched-chain amino acid transport system substrate-binding protein